MTKAGSIFLAVLWVIAAAGAEPALFDQLRIRMKRDPARVLAELRAQPALLRQKDATGQTLLHLAAQVGDRPLIEFLVESGLAVDAASPVGVTPLTQACLGQNVETATALLELGADPNGKGSESPLHLVAGCGRGLCSPPRGQEGAWLALARLLLDRGARVNARATNDWTPMHYAAEANNPAMVELLARRGGAVDARDGDGNTPLHLAVSRVCPLSVEALLKVGCRPGLRNQAGETALDLARRRGLSPRILRLLSAPPHP
ncbi:MAG: ankyrin repeat domain-containing protein [Candidatus Eremiobacterota bacterium]